MGIIVQSLKNSVYAGIELGGTKVKCGIADETGNLIVKTEFATETPEIVFNKIEEYFSVLRKDYLILSLGIASFGPIEKRNSVKKFGYIKKNIREAAYKFKKEVLSKKYPAKKHSY